MDPGSLMLSHLTDASVRSLCLALVAVLALLAARVRSVSARHAVWTAVLGAMLLLPFLTPLLPPIPVPILRSPPVVEVMPPAPQPMVRSMVTARGSTVAQSQPVAPRLTWQQYGLALYLIVALALLARLLVSYLLVNRLVRCSGLVACDLLDELAGLWCAGPPRIRIDHGSDDSGLAQAQHSAPYGLAGMGPGEARRGPDPRTGPRPAQGRAHRVGRWTQQSGLLVSPAGLVVGAQARPAGRGSLRRLRAPGARRPLPLRLDARRDDGSGPRRPPADSVGGDCHGEAIHVTPADRPRSG